MKQTLRREVASFDASLPLSHARTIPGRWYHDARIAILERQAIFGETWQCVARSDQLVAAGSFATAEVAGEPIVIVRDDAGILRAFFNVCRHRAACVVTEPEGMLRRLRCRYHGWTYDLNGRLLGAPEFDGVADFSREESGLMPVEVGTWGPLVFVCLSPRAPPLAEMLAPLPERMGSLAGFRFVERRLYELACNWKVFVDNYLDGGYHVNSVHPSLAGVLQYVDYKTEVFESTSLQTSPLRPPNSKDHDTSASTVRTGELAAYGWAFPNFMVNLYAGVMDTNVVMPLGAGACRVTIDFYISQPDGDEARTFAAESVEVGHRIQLEDVGVCEDVQRGLASRSYDTGRYSVRREGAVLGFHQVLSRGLSSGLHAAPSRKSTRKRPGAKASPKGRGTNARKKSVSKDRLPPRKR